MLKYMKKFWYIILVPIGLFILSIVFKKDTSGLKKLLKTKRQEIDKENKEIEEIKKLSKAAKEKVKKDKKAVKKIIKTNLENKNGRDEKAKDYFSDI